MDDHVPAGETAKGCHGETDQQKPERPAPGLLAQGNQLGDRPLVLGHEVRLAPGEARAGTMAPDSVSEQTGAGLVSLTAEEFARIGSLNAAYRTKFGHPFIIAVRNHTKHGIFAAFERRL